MTNENSSTDIQFGSTAENVWLYNSPSLFGPKSPWLQVNNSFSVPAYGWMIVGRPTLRQLLRYWWDSCH